MSKHLIYWIILITFIINSCQLGPAKPDMTLAEVEQFIGTPLPTEASQVQYASEAGIDRIVYLRFQLPAAALEGFLSSLNFDKPLRTSFQPFPSATGTELEWWLKNAPSAFVGSSKNTGSLVYEVLVDQSDAVVYTVYLRVYEL